MKTRLERTIGVVSPPNGGLEFLFICADHEMHGGTRNFDGIAMVRHQFRLKIRTMVDYHVAVWLVTEEEAIEGYGWKK